MLYQPQIKVYVHFKKYRKYFVPYIKYMLYLQRISLLLSKKGIKNACSIKNLLYVCNVQTLHIGR